MQNSAKEWIFIGDPLTEETLLCCFLQKQKITAKTNVEMMGVKLCPAVYPQII